MQSNDRETLQAWKEFYPLMNPTASAAQLLKQSACVCVCVCDLGVQLQTYVFMFIMLRVYIYIKLKL